MKLQIPMLVGWAALSVLSGCNLAKTLLDELSGDGTAEVSAEPTTEEPAAPTPSDVPNTAPPTDEPATEETLQAASNEADIERFDAETKLDGDADERQASISLDGARLLESPPDGALVRTLPKATEVERVALHEGHTLVLVANPEQKEQRLLGWVVDSSLSQPGDAPSTPPAGTNPPPAQSAPVAPSPKPVPAPVTSPKPLPSPSPPPTQVNPPKPAPQPPPDTEPKKKKKKKVGEKL